MSTGLLVIVTVIYLAVAADYWLGDQKGMTLVFAAYALANVGLIVANLER